MSPKTRKSDATTARERLKAAESFLQTGGLVAEWNDEDDPYRTNSAVTNYIHAGIAAADALCAATLGEYSQGEDHRQAIGLLQRVAPDGKDLARALATLLSLKTDAGYGARALTADKAKRAERAATKLVDEARTRVR